ncbi:Protein of unknown function (DUF3421) [Popillia japonica]|uniref:Uncharacterized protein n=1 Tax=Popillia japonica TaxID=7064 RepID=A0AAW1MRV4_POPJA
MFKTFLVVCVISADTILNTGNAVQDFYWRDYAHGIIPDDAFEGKPGIYIGQAYFKNGGLLPAAIYPYTNAAVAIYDTRREIKEHIKILCSRDRRKFYWEAINFTNNNEGDLANAVVGGFQHEQNLLIGVAKHDGKWKIGKVKPDGKTDAKGLFVWTEEGKHLRLVDCFLLKYNQTASVDYIFDVRSS